MQPRGSREAPCCLQSRVRAGVAGVDPLANQRRLLKCPRAERAGCTAPTRLQQRSRQDSLAVCGEICGPDSLPRAVRPDAEGAQQLLEPGKLPARRERRYLRQGSEKVRGTRKAPLGALRLPEIASLPHTISGNLGSRAISGHLTHAGSYSRCSRRAASLARKRSLAARSRSSTACARTSAAAAGSSRSAVACARQQGDLSEV